MTGGDNWNRRLLAWICLVLALLIGAAAILIVRDSCANLPSPVCLQLIHTGRMPPAMAEVRLPKTILRDLARPAALAAGPLPDPVSGRASGGDPPGPAVVPPVTPAAAPAAADTAGTSTDAYPAIVQYPLSAWNAVDFRTGFIDDAVLLPDREPVARTGAMLPAGGAIELSGWAGHSTYGMRSAMVLFAMCGQVVGHTTTGRPRPDVGAAIHPNLDWSGWVAVLATDSLPRCSQPLLGAWAVAPVGRNIFPLAGAIPVTTIAAPATTGRRFGTSARVFRPDDNPPAATVTLHAARPDSPVRRCAAEDCAIVARLAAAPGPGYVIERRDGWVLIQVDAAAGWIAGRDLRAE